MVSLDDTKPEAETKEQNGSGNGTEEAFDGLEAIESFAKSINGEVVGKTQPVENLTENSNKSPHSPEPTEDEIIGDEDDSKSVDFDELAAAERQILGEDDEEEQCYSNLSDISDHNPGLTPSNLIENDTTNTNVVIDSKKPNESESSGENEENVIFAGSEDNHTVDIPMKIVDYEGSEDKDIDNVVSTEEVEDIVNEEQIDDIVNTEMVEDVVISEKDDDIVNTEQVEDIVNTESIEDIVNTESIEDIVSTERVEDIVSSQQTEGSEEVEDIVSNEPEDIVNTESIEDIVNTESIEDIVSTERVEDIVSSQQTEGSEEVEDIVSNEPEDIVNTESIEDIVNTERVEDIVSSQQTEVSEEVEDIVSNEPEDIVNMESIEDIVNTESIEDIVNTEPIEDIVNTERVEDIVSSQQTKGSGQVEDIVSNEPEDIVDAKQGEDIVSSQQTEGIGNTEQDEDIVSSQQAEGTESSEHVEDTVDSSQNVDDGNADSTADNNISGSDGFEDAIDFETFANEEATGDSVQEKDTVDPETKDMDGIDSENKEEDAVEPETLVETGDSKENVDSDSCKDSSQWDSATPDSLEQMDTTEKNERCESNSVETRLEVKDGDSTQPVDEGSKSPSVDQHKEDPRPGSTVSNITSEEADRVVLSEESDVEFVEELPKVGASRRKTAFDVTPTKPLVTGEGLREKLHLAITRKRTTAEGERKVCDVANQVLAEEAVHTSQAAVEKVLESEDFVAFANLSLPPSQVVHLLSSYASEQHIRSFINELFPNQPVPMTPSERAEVQRFKLTYPAPNVTYSAYSVGFNLAQEYIYSDIVNFRNLPEKPRDLEVYRKVVTQLKPILEGLKRKNEPYKLPTVVCHLCEFKTDSEIVLYDHKLFPHQSGRTWVCCFCDFECDEKIDMTNHYRSVHSVRAKYERPMGKSPCPCCEEEFQYKGVLAQHYRICKRNVRRMRRLLESGNEEIPMCNTWLWLRPPEAVTSGIKVRLVNQSGVGVAVMNSGLQNRVFTTAGGGGVMPRQYMPTLRASAPMLTGSGAQPLRTIGLQRRPVANVFPMRQQQTVTNPPPLIRQPFQQQRFPVGYVSSMINCEICDAAVDTQARYLRHLQFQHKQMLNKNVADMENGPPLGCSRCKERFWTYEGLERHLVMLHGLVTTDLLAKAQKRTDSGKCRSCGKQYAFNLLQHLVQDHQKKLCSAEIMYSCDVCSYQCSSYIDLENHLATKHTAKTQQFVPPDPAPRQSAPLPSIYQNQNKRPAQSQMIRPDIKRARVEMPRAPPTKARIKYTCTPCALKFEQYHQVIAHWQEKHLKKTQVRLCHIDQCPQHQSQVESKYKVDWTMPEPTPIEDSNGDIITLD